MTTAPTPPAPPGASRLPWLLRGAAAAAIAVLFYSPARIGLDPTLDHSNYATYAYFTAHGFPYGEIVPMAGPYGFVPYGFLYAGHLFGERLALELLTKLALGALLVWFFARAAGGWVRWAWLAAVLLMMPLVEDLAYDLAIFFAGLCLLEIAFDRRRAAVATALAAFLALLTLFKGTQAMLSLATFGLLIALAVGRREFRPLARLLAAYLGALVVLMWAAGQSPLALPGYLRGTFELSSGYNEAMALDEPRLAFLTGAGALLALLGAAAALLLARRHEPAAWPGLLLFAAFTFVEWKHGFVRADGHVFIFYQYACIAAPTLWLLARGGALPARWARWTAGSLAAAGAALGFFGDAPASVPRHLWVFEEIPVRVRRTVRQLTAPAAAKRALGAELQHRRAIYRLPRTQDRVGRARVDFYGTEHGYLLLNRLDYRPRPMGGGAFNVFTAGLQDRNEAFVANEATAPRFFLVRPETIDERFLAQDDPGTLRALLACYAPVDVEQGMLLLARRDGRPSVPAPRLMGATALTFGQSVPVPEPPAGHVVAVELTIRPSLSGRLRTLLYKPSLVFLHLEGEGIDRPTHRRLVPGLFRRPVLLAPVIEDVHDLLDLYSAGPGKRVRQLRITTDGPGGFDAGSMEARFYSIPRPEAIERSALADLRARLEFPVAGRVPARLEPPGTPHRRFEGLLVRMMEPPGAISFGLDGSENSVRFVYGIDPEAYTKWRTDGVEFLAEVQQPGQAPRIVFKRWLRPRREPADGGFHEAVVALPPNLAGGTLTLRTAMGADNDGAWDWGFFAGIDLRAGGFVPAQFPGFARLPEAVDAATAGAMAFEGREIFMLNAPGTLRFGLRGSERQLTFSVGILPGAYANGGNSNGVEFIVRARPPGTGEPRVLFSRHLNPRDVPGDRGDQVLLVSLPALPAGTILELVAAPGPHGDLSWDWSYVAGLRLE